MPGLLISYFGAFGKGNTEFEPDWKVNSCFLSWEHEYFVLTGMFYTGVGNSKGTYVNSENESIIEFIIEVHY